MPTVFQKLNLKDQGEIVVLNAPPSFAGELAGLKGVNVVRDLKKVKAVGFALAFCTKQAEVDQWSEALAGKATGDVLIWFAYPKGTSRRYRCEFNRDSGWKIIRALGYDSVRIVAIDEDWSALRFRRIEFIKTANR